MHETAIRYYSEKIDQYGATALGVDWNSEESQVLRFRQLLRLVDPSEASSVIDFGCGYGALAVYLRRAGWECRYTGFDISGAMIQHAAAAHQTDARCTFTTDPSTLNAADFTFASGVFNVKQDHPAEVWQEYVLATLDAIDGLSQRGFAFNVLSSYSEADRQRDDLFYGVPGVFFHHCKTRYSRHVALLHDYPLYEFTIVVRK